MTATIEILTRFLELMSSGWVLVCVIGAVLGALGARVNRALGMLVLLPALALGAYKTTTQAALFDDAFVTFRYVDNWVRGLGPVFNEGEYVEGYTNPLWMLLMLVGHLISGAEIPLVALVLNVTVYLALIGVAVAAARVHGGHRYLPFAAALLAVQQSVTAYATTGMETLLGATLVLGAFALMRTERKTAWAAVGLLLALAVVHRLDHALFWGAGLLAAANTYWQARDVQATARRVGLFLAPVTLVLVHLAFKYWFYGDILPNTYYAKATDQWRIDQGWLYLLTFTMSSYTFLLLPLVARWVYAGHSESLPARVFTVIIGLLWPAYILKVGGDFMFSRFCLPLFPVLVVAAEAGAASWRGRGRMLAFAALGATIWGLPFIPEQGTHHWGQADENTVYPLVGLFPVEVRHPSWREGRFFREVLYERGLEIPMGSCCIGMVGYYSRQPLMDFHGLTDAATAHKEIRGRGLPGHEKRATAAEARARGIKLARWEKRDPKHLRKIARVQFPAGSGVRRRAYSLVIWDPETVSALRERAPELRFTDFPEWLDGYIRRARRGKTEPRQVKRDLAWFRAYYFDHNDDPKRLARIERWLRKQSENPPASTENRKQPGKQAPAKEPAQLDDKTKNHKEKEQVE